MISVHDPNQYYNCRAWFLDHVAPLPRPIAANLAPLFRVWVNDCGGEIVNCPGTVHDLCGFAPGYSFIRFADDKQGIWFILKYCS